MSLTKVFRELTSPCCAYCLIALELPDAVALEEVEPVPLEAAEPPSPAEFGLATAGVAVTVGLVVATGSVVALPPA
jgi:hypothetical protein